MMQDLIKTRFRDIAEREKRAQEELNSILSKYEESRNRRSGSLTPQEQAEYDRAATILTEVRKNRSESDKMEDCLKGESPDRRGNEVCEPLFVGFRKLVNDGMLDYILATHNNGFLSFFKNKEYIDHYSEIIANSQKDVDAPDWQPPSVIHDQIVKVSLALGFLILDGVNAPPVFAIKQGDFEVPGIEPSELVPADKDSGGNITIIPDTKHSAWHSLTKSFYEAIGEAKGFHELAMFVLPILANEGDPDGPEGDQYGPNVRVEEFARVMRELHKNGVTTSENQLRRRVNEALDKVQFVGREGFIEEQGINLPDLDEVTDSDIIAENVRLMGPMIVSAMFDELKAFQVVDHLVERFQRGTLSIVSGEAGKLLYRYWREAPNRISEMERRTFYATTMGIPGGEAGDFVNRNFNDLWLRFVSSVSEFVRQGEVDKLLRAGIPSPVSQQQVRKAARDLAANLSLHGYGMAFYAALELQEQIKFMIRLLGNKEICGNFGARDMWQVIDNVATLELGGAKTSSRYRTLATCGTIITAWLSRNANTIMAATGPLLDLDEIHNPPTRISGEKASTHPNDYDLVNACELWLADTGTADSQVEQLSQPYEAPMQTSSPVQVPSVVQDMLSGMGDLGVGFGKSR